MKLTSEEALKLLQEIKGENEKNIGWINHSICVGTSAGCLAEALNQVGYQFDIDKAITLGYIHDIGKKFDYKHDGIFPHIMHGYKYLKSLGYDEEYAGICLKHSFLNNDIDCLANSRDKTDESNPDYDFVKNYISAEYTIYDKIINLCDLMCSDKIMTVDKRLIDLLVRHGVYKNTQYHIKETLKLKDYFDELLGFNLYDLFPEIKEHL